MLQPSPDCLALIKKFEGLHRVRKDGDVEAYLCPAGVPTIGYGSTGPDIVMGLVWTVEQCEERFAEHVEDFAKGVSALLTDPERTTQGQFDALVSFAYNLGLGALRKSTLLRKHNARNYAGAEREFGRWVRAGGKVLRGLVRRRAEEAAVYASS